MFTLDALVAVSIVSITTLTLAYAFHAAILNDDQNIHREVAIQLAYQYTETSKQSHLRAKWVASKTLNGITYDIVVTPRSPNLFMTDPANGLVELSTKVMWTEQDGNPKSVEEDALDAVPIQNG